MIGRVPAASTGLDRSTQLALVCVLFGWFFMNTLVVSLGSLEHGVRFFDMSAVIGDPTRLFFGIDRSAPRILFGAVCVLCILAPLAAELTNKRWARLVPLAPLALIVLSGVLLYSRTSNEFFATPNDEKSMGDHLFHIANGLSRPGGNLVSRHVSIGAGGYLAFIGGLVLAVQGVRRFRHAPR